MPRLGVNIDHVATLRQARGGQEPDPIAAAVLAQLHGADGIVVHLREDRRHIQDRDVRLLREIVSTSLNLEMAADETMVAIAQQIRPDKVTLVPERRQELTTEGGLAVVERRDWLQGIIDALHASHIPVSLFVDPDVRHIEAAHALGAEAIELHTGHYANAADSQTVESAFQALVEGAQCAHKLGLEVNAGHGLNYQNIKRIIGISEIVEVNIGHSIVARAVLVGLGQAVREMKTLVDSGRRHDET
ncbi:MAG: pyridoxine 5'-phosphate synthase [Nitrospirae bacterium]|nr:MAG: pyridoxine 5'-phosphate synthase [Nitrospirota bacterium]